MSIALALLMVACAPLPLLTPSAVERGEAMAWLTVPAMELEGEPIMRARVAGDTWNIRAAGRHVAYIERDDQTAIVLAAHNWAAFKRLPQVLKGDAVTITLADGRIWEYAVFDTRVIDVHDITIFDARHTGANLVLVTCTTAGDDLRWAVFAEFVSGEYDE